MHTLLGQIFIYHKFMPWGVSILFLFFKQLENILYILYCILVRGYFQPMYNTKTVFFLVFSTVSVFTHLISIPSQIPESVRGIDFQFPTKARKKTVSYCMAGRDLTNRSSDWSKTPTLRIISFHKNENEF